MTSQPKRQSPYQRYGKRPFQYSEAHRLWKAAVMKGNQPEARRQSEKHSEQFGPIAWRRQSAVEAYEAA